MIFFGHIGITLLLVFLLFTFLKKKIDYRLLVIGAILPDLIDKPIGHYLFYSTFENGRIFAHTLLFILLLAMAAALVQHRYKFAGLWALVIGAFAHQMEDQMWNTPGTMLWPLLGWQFPKYDLSHFADDIFYELLHDPSAYVPEIIGIAVIAGFVWQFELWRPERAKAFLKTGRLARKEKVAAVAR